jgi:hypothetical protein
MFRPRSGLHQTLHQPGVGALLNRDLVFPARWKFNPGKKSCPRITEMRRELECLGMNPATPPRLRLSTIRSNPERESSEGRYRYF